METFKKRQKEMKRLEKQRDKAARRLQRKLNPLGETNEILEEPLSGPYEGSLDAENPPDAAASPDAPRNDA